jgi:hypothetical protein
MVTVLDQLAIDSQHSENMHKGLAWELGVAKKLLHKLRNQHRRLRYFQVFARAVKAMGQLGVRPYEETVEFAEATRRLCLEGVTLCRFLLGKTYYMREVLVVGSILARFAELCQHFASTGRAREGLPAEAAGEVEDDHSLVEEDVSASAPEEPPSRDSDVTTKAVRAEKRERCEEDRQQRKKKKRAKMVSLNSVVL